VNEPLTPSVGGQQKTKFIPEGDLYRFIIRSSYLPPSVLKNGYLMKSYPPFASMGCISPMKF